MSGRQGKNRTQRWKERDKDWEKREEESKGRLGYRLIERVGERLRGEEVEE